MPQVVASAVLPPPRAADSDWRYCPVLALNRALDRAELPHGLNEPDIASFAAALAGCTGAGRREYWLLAARIVEMALVCAGHYADNCEFSAAGDLLLNPRKIRVHVDDERGTITAKRHGRLSEQLNADGLPWRRFAAWMQRHARLEIAQKALLPEWVERMERSGVLSDRYLRCVRRRMTRVADTIGFLSAWGLSEFGQLHRRMQQVSAAERAFAEAHLCRFDRRTFDEIGRDIRRLAAHPETPSEFLAGG